MKNKTFFVCFGRLSALHQHQWSMSLKMFWVTPTVKKKLKNLSPFMDLIQTLFFSMHDCMLDLGVDPTVNKFLQFSTVQEHLSRKHCCNTVLAYMYSSLFD